MINEVSREELESSGNVGPQIEKTRNAQAAVDEFLGSGLDACSVDWKSIDSNYDKAKRALAYRISHSKYMKLEGARDLSMRSNRAKGEVYLVHADKVDGGGSPQR